MYIYKPHGDYFFGPETNRLKEGAYTHKAHVLHSKDLFDFGVDEEKQITTLNSHAPEIFKDEEGQWFISSVE
jgi:arabinan endo-1,5-alpha-L-arabinosidase